VTTRTILLEKLFSVLGIPFEGLHWWWGEHKYDH